MIVCFLHSNFESDWIKDILANSYQCTKVVFIWLCYSDVQNVLLGIWKYNANQLLSMCSKELKGVHSLFLLVFSKLFYFREIIMNSFKAKNNTNTGNLVTMYVERFKSWYQVCKVDSLIYICSTENCWTVSLFDNFNRF